MTIVVSRGFEPVARIMPLKKRGGARGFGAMKGEIWISPDIERVDEEIEEMFE